MSVASRAGTMFESLEGRNGVSFFKGEPMKEADWQRKRRGHGSGRAEEEAGKRAGKCKVPGHWSTFLTRPRSERLIHLRQRRAGHCLGAGANRPWNGGS